jgi:hypothetical protein
LAINTLGHDLDLVPILFGEHFHASEAFLHGVEPLIDSIELGPEELHKVLVLAFRHDPNLPEGPGWDHVGMGRVHPWVPHQLTFTPLSG